MIKFLSFLNLSPELCRAQTYDGASNMAGHLNGCSALFKAKFPRATYYHCASHELNLALSKTARVAEISCMLSTLTSIGLFFKYSPKRQRYLEESITEYNKELKELGRKEIHKTKIKTMCQTR